MKQFYGVLLSEPLALDLNIFVASFIRVYSCLRNILFIAWLYSVLLFIAVLTFHEFLARRGSGNIKLVSYKVFAMGCFSLKTRFVM